MATAVKSLGDSLAFEAPEVVLRFQREFDASCEESEILFRECKRWLWACARRLEDEQSGKPVPSQLLISPELGRLDEMWHCFLVFTRDYHEFCETYLGRFIHHVPLTAKEIADFDDLRASDPTHAAELRREQLRPQLEYLYDLLGPDVLTEWYRRKPSAE